MYIIHNLKTFRTSEQVETYVNEVLLKSSTFKLRKDFHVTSYEKARPGYHFIELDIKDMSVFHLLFAAEGSEAGNYYNQYTIDFIEAQYINDWKKNKFDVIEEIKSKFCEYSKRYLDQEIKKDDFNSNEDILNKKKIKLKKDKKFSLKKCVIDELGLQTFKGDGFEPQYNYFINENQFEIRVELPGNIEPIIYNPKYIGENTVIIIEGDKKKDKVPADIEDNIFNSRNFGPFNLEVHFKTEDYKIVTKPKSKEKKNGVLIIKYDIHKDEQEDEKLTLKEEEEI